MNGCRKALWRVAGAALSLSVLSAAVPASAETWSDWRYERMVDPATNAVSATADVVIKGGSSADLYTLSVACAAGKVAVTFHSAIRHFKAGSVKVKWKVDSGKQHAGDPWKVLPESDQILYAQNPQELKDLMEQLMQGRKLFFGVSDAEAKSVNVIFPVFGAKQAVLSALSECSGKDTANANDVPVEKNTMYLLVRGAPLRYPGLAKKEGKAGSADVSYTITEDGKVADAKLVSEDPPGLGFGDAALESVKKWLYQPQRKDGKPLKRAGVLTHLTFNPKDSK
jgi:TonB family protein